MSRRALAWGAVVALVAAEAALLSAPDGRSVACGPGFVPHGARCLPDTACPAPYEVQSGACVAAKRIEIPRTRILVGSSDWEAAGRVASRTIDAGPFWIDAFEVTTGAFAGHRTADGFRAASGISRAEAASYCAARGGRLPTGDEWTAAAAGSNGRRYPWGDTGAVCRRAAFGLVRGPCASGATGPDSVGAHTGGDSANGLHDLAGNVAEWVAPAPDAPSLGVAKGGSWRSELASDLRVWARLDLDPEAHDDRVGVRCAYDRP